MPDPTQGIIRIDVVVSDKSGRPVSGLTAQDFTLLDNGQPQKVVTFKAFDNTDAKPDPPAKVILVIDELDLPPLQIEAAKAEAEKFLRADEGRLRQPVAIYWVSSRGISGTAKSSTDGNVLADAIAAGNEGHLIGQSPSLAEKSGLGLTRNQGPVRDGGSTDFEEPIGVPPNGIARYDMPASAMDLATITIEERRKPGRKLLFWIGPGWHFDTGWQLHKDKDIGLFDFLTELSTRLREARIELWRATDWPFYDSKGRVVPVESYVATDFLKTASFGPIALGNLTLQALATQSGGGDLEPGKGLYRLIAEHAAEANRFFTLTFDPVRTNVVDEGHDLKVEVNAPDLSARTVIGYYDEPVYYDQQPDHIEHMTVEELEKALTSTGGESTGEVAHQLHGMELTERLSTQRLAKLIAALKNKKAREALTALADQSVFLEPPANEILSTPPPDMATKKQMVNQAIAYVNQSIPRLPDFLAARTTVQYHETPPKPGQTWKTAMGDQSLYEGETAKAIMRFRNGKEIVEKETTNADPENPERRIALTTIGTFGPILATVLAGATGKLSEITWSRWEEGATGPEAVFHYKVPGKTSLFETGFCCLAIDNLEYPFREKAPFHGEFAVDPASGAILRLTIEADVEQRLPLERSGLMVEYGPVVIGGKTYICPQRSVSISRQRTVMNLNEWNEHLKVYAPFDTILNEMTFSKYHFFGSNVRILPGFTPE